MAELPPLRTRAGIDGPVGPEDVFAAVLDAFGLAAPPVGGREGTAVPADQWWFWTGEWQAGEREASAQFAAGGLPVYEDMAALFADLGNAEHATPGAGGPWLVDPARPLLVAVETVDPVPSPAGAGHGELWRALYAVPGLDPDNTVWLELHSPVNTAEAHRLQQLVLNAVAGWLAAQAGRGWGDWRRIGGAPQWGRALYALRSQPQVRILVIFSEVEAGWLAVPPESPLRRARVAVAGRVALVAATAVFTVLAPRHAGWPLPAVATTVALLVVAAAPRLGLPADHRPHPATIHSGEQTTGRIPPAAPLLPPRAGTGPPIRIGRTPTMTHPHGLPDLDLAPLSLTDLGPLGPSRRGAGAAAEALDGSVRSLQEEGCTVPPLEWGTGADVAADVTRWGRTTRIHVGTEADVHEAACEIVWAARGYGRQAVAGRCLSRLAAGAAGVGLAVARLHDSVGPATAALLLAVVCVALWGLARAHGGYLARRAAEEAAGLVPYTDAELFGDTEDGEQHGGAVRADG